MKEESHNPWTDPELEARIVALVLGEASDFEREELNRLMQEWPDLAALKQQIQGVHGLLQQAETEEPVDLDEDWKLPAEKRRAVLAAIGAEAEHEAAEQIATPAHQQLQPPARRSRLWSMTQIAAALCVAGLIGITTILVLSGSKQSARVRHSKSAENSFRQLGLALHNYDDVHFLPDLASDSSGNGARHGVVWREAIGKMSTDQKYVQAAEPAVVAEQHYGENSRSALAAIRGTLDADGALPRSNYLNDDVQYFDAGREFKVPRGSAAGRFADTAQRGKAPTADAGGLASGLSDFGASVNDPAGVTGQITAVEGKPDSKQSGIGDRSASQRPLASKAVGDGLSFPVPDADARDLGIVAPVEAGRMTVTVTDGSTVLLGGVKRLVSSRSESDASGKSADAPVDRLGDGESRGGWRWQDDVNGQTAASRRSSEVSNGSASSSGLPALGFGVQGSGQQQGIALPERRARRDADSLEGDRAKDAPAAGETPDRLAADSRGQSAGQKPRGQEVTAEGVDAWHRANELADSPTAPAGGPLPSKEPAESTEGLSVANGRRVEEETKTRSIDSSGDGAALYSAGSLVQDRTPSIQVPQLGTVTLRSNQPDVLSLPAVVPPTTGTVVGQPPGKSESEPAKQDGYRNYALDLTRPADPLTRESETTNLITHAAEGPDRPSIVIEGYESRAVELRAKESLGKLSELSDFEKNMDMADDRSQYRYEDAHDSGNEGWRGRTTVRSRCRLNVTNWQTPTSTLGPDTFRRCWWTTPRQ